MGSVPSAHDRPVLPAPLETLHRQLWFAVDPSVQFGVRPPRSAPLADNSIVERYWLLPTANRVRLLLPAARRPAAGAAINYRHLRPLREHAARAFLGTLASAGLPVSARLLHIEVPNDGSAAAATLPTRAIASALDRDEIYCAVGVRTGANAKATLHIVDSEGAPIGYAKLGWNPVTDEYVRTETAALSALNTGQAARAPAVLAAFEYAGHPVIVTAPLPADVKAVRGRVPPPTAAELAALCPLVRHALPNTTRQMDALRARLRRLDAPLVAEPAGHALRLLDQVASSNEELPVAARWHGDLTPWNCARGGDGVLWTWDWESSEVDAVAGLDALHWAFSERREQVTDVAAITIADCLDAASRHLTAFGISPAQRHTVASVYVATVIERACNLALSSGGWDAVWINPRQLIDLALQVAE